MLPKQLRTTDKTTLTWNQLRLVLASVALRDRILLTLDMTETFRPSELFALRWCDFDMDSRTLTVRRTAFRGKLRDFGKTRMSLRAVHVPQGLANDLWPLEAGVPRCLRRCLHLLQFAQAQGGDEERLHPHGQLSRPGAEEAGRGAD